MYVFDATPLIYLATVERLSLVLEHVDDAVLPERVHEEVVVRGNEEGHADARRIERVVDTGSLRVVSASGNDVFGRIARNQQLTDADAAVLAIADTNNAVAVMDEQYGRDVADAEGIRTRGTAFLVLRLLREGILDAEATRTIVDEMVEAGWYCAPNLYARILGKIEELETT
ncbi:putative nucleic acid-binding protein, contains PIN domain [Salinarchaeum sp. Harcht-Bsk1]|uniref:DUF3368 domain-containing protein n=1 Tax=Salinarchaeum sp. Harcht-Bsk1 TaxID=1333523 RepID=UPI0003422FAB|nr:DUF3368 domain-containing protein [Salinarchaeum sp. Harcht-Bsk1]AGN00793.1 putative nucleic acid-binding protein, contains PIN domain [Salinarchaeum sp. Harcht-Bsk1]